MFNKVIFFSGFLLLTQIALAQPKDAPYTLPPPVPIQVTPPDQFSNQVANITAQKHAAFQQQLKQSIAQIPPPNYRAMAQKNPVPDNSQNPQPSSDTATAPPTNAPEDNSEAQNTVPPPSEQPPPTMPNNPAITTKTPPPQQQAQPYTGFQPPANNKMPVTPSSQPKASGGGWNIKY